MVAADKLADVLTTFARALVTEYAIDEMLDRLCKEVCAVLNVDGAGVMLEDESGSLRFVAASDDLVRSIEALQIELGEGPCLHAYRSGEMTLMPNLHQEDRFPRFSARALAAGMGSVHSFPLVADSESVGALNIYTAQPAELDDAAADAGRLLADVATTYILNARTLAESTKLTSQLQRALDSRVVIEQAKGKLSEQLGVPVTQAFEIMRTYARNHGLRLNDVAADIVRGDLRLPASP